MSISKDEYIRFFIENYGDIEALEELITYAKSKIPTLLDKEMNNYISEIDIDKINFRLDDGNAWWYDPDIYDESQEKGIFFGYESNWNSLFSGNDPDDASYLYLCVDPEHLKTKKQKKEYIDQWIKTLRKKAGQIRKAKISFIADIDYDDPEILKYPLNREINMVTLGDREKLKKAVQKTVKSFTMKLLPILK